MTDLLDQLDTDSVQYLVLKATDINNNDYYIKLEENDEFFNIFNYRNIDHYSFGSQEKEYTIES